MKYWTIEYEGRVYLVKAGTYEEALARVEAGIAPEVK